jgi:hypothetical protein
VLPDRFVRIRYYGLMAHRHREQSLALCREVAPGAPVRPPLTKSDWQSLLRSLTGHRPDEMRALWTERSAPPQGLGASADSKGSAAMIPLIIVAFKYLSAQPRTLGVVYRAGLCGIIASTKSCSGG